MLKFIPRLSKTSPRTKQLDRTVCEQCSVFREITNQFSWGQVSMRSFRLFNTDMNTIVLSEVVKSPGLIPCCVFIVELNLLLWDGMKQIFSISSFCCAVFDFYFFADVAQITSSSVLQYGGFPIIQKTIFQPTFLTCPST